MTSTDRTHDIMQTITSTPATLAADIDTAAPLDPSRPVVIVAGDVRQTLAAGWSPEDIGGAMQAAYDAAVDAFTAAMSAMEDEE